MPNWKEWIENKRLCYSWLQNYKKKGMLKKTRLTKQQHLNKAKHNLDFANWVKRKHNDELPELFGEDKFYDWVVSAYYYAIYHASLALISAKELSSKSHNATLCAIIWFYYHETKHLDEDDIKLVNESIDKEDIKIITQTKDLRERASYGVSGDFELKIVEKAQNNCIYFIGKASEVLN